MLSLQRRPIIRDGAVHGLQDRNLGSDISWSLTFTFDTPACGAKYLMVATRALNAGSSHVHNQHRLQHRIVENGSGAALHHHSLTNEKFRSFAVWRPRLEMNLTLDWNLMQRRNPCTGTKLPTYCGWRTSHHQTRVGRNLDIRSGGTE